MTNRKFLTLVAGVAALSVTACKTDELVKVNNNPNNPTVAPAPALFTNAVRVTVSRWLGVGYDQRSLTLTAQHFAEVQYPDTDAYRRLAANFTTGFFDNAYAQELEDFQQVINANVELNEPGLYGPAMVMRTWGFGYLTDSWGDIPYFSALVGDVDPAGLFPAYDPQKDIYADFFKILAKATADMAAASSTNLRFGSADPIFAGNLTRWTRFSNSLRARHAMRLANVDPTTGKAEFAAALAAPNGLMASNADNAQFTWPGDGVYDNPWSANFATRDDHRMSNVIMNILVPTNDPRLPIYAQPNAAGGFAGMPNALTHNNAQAFFNTASRPGAVFYPGATVYGTFGGGGKIWPSFLMTYAEVSLLKAEAAERGWIAGSAATFYADGIRASMAQWGVTNTAAIDAYIASAPIAYAGGTAGLRQIATQKWLALYSDGGQAWAEWRRTCVPNTVKPGPDATIGTVPRRLQYSITENAVNATNVDAAKSRQGADLFTSRMYWDTNPTAAPTYTAGCGQR
jgi:hypothetical protein